MNIRAEALAHLLLTCRELTDNKPPIYFHMSRHVYIGIHAIKTWPWHCGRGSILPPSQRSQRVPGKHRYRFWPHIGLPMRCLPSSALFTRKMGCTRRV